MSNKLLIFMYGNGIIVVVCLFNTSSESDIIGLLRTKIFGDEKQLYDLEPTMDFAFKRLFGYDDTKESVISSSNAMFNGKPSC